MAMRREDGPDNLAWHQATHLEAEVAQGATQIIVDGDGDGLGLQQLAMGQ